MAEDGTAERTSHGKEYEHGTTEARVYNEDESKHTAFSYLENGSAHKLQNGNSSITTDSSKQSTDSNRVATKMDEFPMETETTCESFSETEKRTVPEKLPLLNNDEEADATKIRLTKLNTDLCDTTHGRVNCQSNAKTIQRATSCYDNAPDGGWGWVVTFAAFMVGVILDGISFSFGIFFRELLLHFKESKSLTSWIISVLNGTYLGIGPLSSILVSGFGCRRVAVFGAVLAAVAFFLCTYSPNVQVMIVLYGLLGGTGLGLLYLPSIVTVGHYFKKRRALATGIAVCGSGIGGFVFAPLSDFLIEMYTWKGAMWIISAIVLNGIPIAMLLRPLEGSEEEDRRRRNATKDGVKTRLTDNNTCDKNNMSNSTTQCCDLSTMFDFELLKSPTFLVYGLSCFLCMLGFYIPFTYIPDLADELGMTSHQGAMLISVIGILNTVARVLVGWLADRPWADPLKINSVALMIGGLATMFVPYYANYGAMVMYCVVFGVSIAVFVSYRSIIMAELLGIEKLTSSFGLVTMCQGLSAFIGAPIAGALSDQAGDYEGAFYLAGAAIGLSGVICIPLRAVCRWETRKARNKSTANGNVYKSSTDLEIYFPETRTDGTVSGTHLELVVTDKPVDYENKII